MPRRPAVACALLGLFAALLAALGAAPADAAAGTLGTFTSVAPTRLLDTRTGLGGATPAATGTVHLQVLGAGPVPSTGVSAVVLNVTVIAPAASGYVTVWADGAPRPGVSNLNFRAGQTVPNLVVAPVGGNGRVSLYNGSPGRTQLAADVAGYYTAGAATGPGTFTPVAPARLLDTRSGLGGSTPAANGTVHLPVAGHGGVPANGVAAVVLNVTVIGPAAGGYVTVSADGAPRPGASNLNFVAGQTVPNLVVAPVGSDGAVALYNGSAGAAPLAADVAGYFLAGTASAPGAFVPVTPARLLNTRSAQGGTTPGPYGTVDLQVTGQGGVPEANVAAVVLNVTVTGPAANGFVTVYAGGGASRPGASNLNFLRGRTVPNLVVAPVGPDGTVALYNGSPGATQLIADVAGYYLSAPVGAIGGTITRAGDHAPVANATVVVHDPAGNPVASTSTAGNGSYRIGTLAPGDYVVCADGGSAPGGPYVDECWADQPWDGFSAPPTGTTTVPVTAGQTSAVNMALASTQGIAGTVTASGTGLAGVAVQVLDDSGAQVGTATTGTGGSYSVALDTGSYTVCFDASQTTGGPSATGYRSQCFRGIAWAGGPADVPDGTTPVDVDPGVTHSGVDAALTAGGAITGRVGSGSDGLTGAVITAFDDAGDAAGTATSAAGAYSLPGLAPGDYTVCVDGTGATGGPSLGGYVSQCSGATAWVPADLPADGAATTTVIAGRASTVDAALSGGGALAGAVTAGGNGVAGVLLTAFDPSGQPAGSATTDASGAYRLGGLPAGSYRVCADSRPAAGVPATGWVDQCYGGALWDAATGLPALGALALSAVVNTLVPHADLHLLAGARLAGTITETGSAAPLGDVEVSVFAGRTLVAQATTGSGGGYVLTGVPAGAYTVCFDATFATGGTSPTGSYASECWNGVAWDTDPADLPLGTTPVVLTAGASRAAVGAVLDDA